MEDIDNIDYEAEVQRFSDRLSSTHMRLQDVSSSSKMKIAACYQQHFSNMVSRQDTLERLRQRMEELRQNIKQRQMQLSQERESIEQMRRTLEENIVALRGKREEVERQKETLADLEEEIKKKEQWVSETKQRNQDKVKVAESSIELFKTHLGLDIISTHHSTIVFKFTQVSRAHPEKEYLLEMNLEGENYRLLNSEPPLPSLPQLQDALNAAGNLPAFIAHVRKQYQRMDTKRSSE